MKIQSNSQNNPGFGKLHAPRNLKFYDFFPSKKLLDNPAIKHCAEKFDVFVENLGKPYPQAKIYSYSLQGAHKGFKTTEYRLEYYNDFRRIYNLSKEIEVQIRESLMRIVAENYPQDGIFKSKDILNILALDEVKNNFDIDDVFNYSFEQSGQNTLLTKFFEINPNNDNKDDYNKVISILKSNPKINFNQKDNLGISVLENIFNLENEQALDLVEITKFDYTKDLDNLFNNIKNKDFKKKALGVKIKFPSYEQISNQEFSPESLEFLKSPFCDSKNSAVIIWLNCYNRCYTDETKTKLFDALYEYLPEYYRNHYKRPNIRISSIIRLNALPSKNFVAPPTLELVDKTISSRELLGNFEIRKCIEKYSVVVERGAQNGVVKKKVPRFFSFLPPKIVEEPRYEYTLKGVKKGETENIETQKHLILVSVGIDSYIRGLVNEIEIKDKARFVKIISQKCSKIDDLNATEILNLLECDEIKGNYSREEALLNSTNPKGGGSLLSKFLGLKEIEQNQEDYEKIISIINSAPNLNLNYNSLLGKVLTLENTKALDLFADKELVHSKHLDQLLNNAKDKKFKEKAKKLKFQFPDAVEQLKNPYYRNHKFMESLSYLDSPFCDSRKEAIRIWTALKTEFDIEQSRKLNAMLYKYLPDNLKLDL